MSFGQSPQRGGPPRPSPFGGPPAGQPMGGSPFGGPPPGPAMPVGGSLPGLDDGQTQEDSPLLAALAASLGGGQQGEPTDLNVGPADPGMGIEQLLQMLALGGMGVGGGEQAGGSGVPQLGSRPGMAMNVGAQPGGGY